MSRRTGRRRRWFPPDGRRMTAAAALTLRFVLGAIFVSAGAVKVAKLDEFETAIDRYELIPWKAVPRLARMIAWGEVMIGIALLAGAATFVASLVAGTMLVGFAIGVAVNLARGRHFDCGCGTAAVARKISWGLAAQDLFLATCAFLVAAAAPAVMGVDALFESAGYDRGQAWAAPTTAVLVLVGLALIREMRAVHRVMS